MFARLFLSHPAAVGESYFEHMRASLTVAHRLAGAAAKCCIHAVVPGWCKTAGSDAILRLHAEITPRRFDQPTF